MTSQPAEPSERYQHGDGHTLTADCPLQCLATAQLSAKSFNPLNHELPWLLGRPATVGDVTRLYLYGYLRYVRHLGPRRLGEIGLVLTLADLLSAPPRDPRTTTHAPTPRS